MKKSVRIYLALFCLPLLLWGCFSIRNITFISPDKGAKISLDMPPMPAAYAAYGYGYGYGYNNGTGSTITGNTDSLQYPVYKSFSPASLDVRIEKKGYRTKIYTVKKPFPTRIGLPSLTPYPPHKDGQRQLYVDRVSIHIDSNNIVKNFYNSMNDYTNGKIMVTAPDRDKVTYKETSINEDLNKILIDLNYIDTATDKKLNFLDYNWVKIYSNITGLSINYISSSSQTNIDLTCSWKIKECLTGKTIYEKTISSTSNWGYENDTLILDAVKQGLLDLLIDPKVQTCLENGTITYQNIYNTWDALNIAQSPAYATTIQQATKAVVTIKLPHGHGSGCLISSDGYIITNSHVAGDTNQFAVIFENGDTHYAKLIRSNPIYDLALLKVDTIPARVKPLKIVSEDDWSIGNDVYAIGTPEDLDLGQTLTRGIVSAIRVIQDKKYIQTDVSINPGNSGGALTNTDGALVGIVKAKLVGEKTEGLGFAIPSDYITKGLKLNFQ